MKVTILGNNSALPAFGRHPSAQTVAVGGEVILIDCGEGTQIQMQKYGVKWRRLRHIFISHLHGDHYFGLPGLINSMSLMGRTEPLHIYCPAALQTIVELTLQVADTVLSYPIHYHPLPEGDALLMENSSFSLACFPVQHRIACHGLVITTKNRLRKVLPRQCEAHKIPFPFYESLKDGHDYITPEGNVIPNNELTDVGAPSRKYAYCADTLYTDSYLPWITGADAIYHESTYLEADSAKAVARFHSTASQAATIAHRAGTKLLLLGHFSSKYKDVSAFKLEAAAVFEAVEVTEEGRVYEV